jgi:hypothetical protein
MGLLTNELHHQPELQLHIEEAVEKESAARDIADRFIIGCLLEDERRLRKGYGRAAVASIARERKYGLQSVSAVYHHLKLCHCWKLKLALAADDAGLTWPAVINLLSYEPTPSEAELAKNDPVLQGKLDQRIRQRDWFIAACRDETFSSGEIIDEIARWKKENSALWPEPKRHRLCLAQKDSLIRDLDRMKDKVDLYQGTLADAGDVQIDEPKQLSNLINVIDQLDE